MNFASRIALSAVAALTVAVTPTYSTIGPFGCSAPVVLDATTNVWNEFTLHPNTIYRAIVTNAVANLTDPGEKAKALKVANTGTFALIERNFRRDTLSQLISDVPCDHILGLVLSGLADHSPGCDGFQSLPADANTYLKDFVEPIAASIRVTPNTAFAIILEPGVLPIFALSPNKSCKPLRDDWHQNVPMALKALDLPNVIMYLDGGNGGVFGWTGRAWEGKTTQPPKWFHQHEGTAIQGATELAETWKAAGPLSQFRGLAINVAGYNSWDMSPGENFAGETSCYDLYNKARNEKRYLQHLLTQGLQKINSSMPSHNIMDTSRNGQQGVRENWSDWCNVNGAVIGRKPSADTGDANLDAFVWATEPGVSDGRSDVGGDCGGEVSFKPMPEKGRFSLVYFRMMLDECRGCVKRRAMPEIAVRCG